MPDRCIDEETENRKLCLCLFQVAGISVPNRCSNCPGAARDPINHRRCPREPLQPNVFRPEEQDSKNTAALKSLASSSKQPDYWRHEADTVLPDRFARLSLDPDRTFRRSESDPDIPGGRAELCRTPLIPHGVKRKPKLEDREEASSLAKCKYPQNEVHVLSVEEYLKSKPQKLFRDLELGNLYIPGCLHIPSDEMTALLNGSASSLMDTQEDRPLREVSRPSVAGCCINTDGVGLLPCNDGIETAESEVFARVDEMEF